MKNEYDIIIKPIVTEASIKDLKNKKYIFEISRYCDKIMVKKAIEKIFNVSVKKVNTIKTHYKWKKVRNTIGKTNSKRKAIITLHKNSNSINIFDDFLQ